MPLRPPVPPLRPPQDSWEDLRTHAKARAAPEYVSENPSYWGCAIDGALIVLTVMFATQGAMGIFQAVQPIQNLAAAVPAADGLLSIISRVSEIDSFSEEGLKPSSVKGDIEVKDVVFAYPSAPDHLVCKGYTVSIPAGQTVALSGASGSGKSTIIQLLERFYDPQSGTITLDGANLKDLNVRWLRQQLGLVSQEPVLFMGSVSENIRYGKKEATQAEVEEAARSANAYDFITTTLSDGFPFRCPCLGTRRARARSMRASRASQSWSRVVPRSSSTATPSRSDGSRPSRATASRTCGWPRRGSS